MDKRLLILIIGLLCAFELNAQENKRLVVNETWNSTGNTKKLCYFYGPDDQLLRSRNYKRDEAGTGWTLVDYTAFEFDSNGKLVHDYTQPYRMVNGEMTQSKINNVHYYEYDTEGRVSKITYPYGETCTRTYDENNHYVKGDSVNGKNLYTIVNEYSDDKLIKITCSSTTSTYASANYTTTFTYDENGNVLTEYKCSPTPSTSYSTNWLKEYVYTEDGRLSNISHWVLKSDGTKNYIKYYTTYDYELVNAQLRVTEKKFSHAAATSTSYTDPSTWNVYVYDEVDGKKYSPTLSVASANELGTATQLTIGLPTSTDTPTLHVYRNGFEVGSGITFAPNENGVMLYEDTGLANGNYEYFVEWENHNISEIVNYNLHVSLPAPKNIRVTDTRVKTGVDDEGEEYNEYYATIEWDEIEKTENAEFKYFDIYMNGILQNLKNEDGSFDDDPADYKFEVQLSGKPTDELYIVAVYDIDKVKSEVLKIQRPGSETVKGDVDGNGELNLFDVQTLSAVLCGDDSKKSDACDLDGDGKVSLNDLTLLIKLILESTK